MMVDFDKSISTVGYSQNAELVDDTVLEQLIELKEKVHLVYDYNLSKGFIKVPVITLKSKINDKKIQKKIRENTYFIELSK